MEGNILLVDQLKNAKKMFDLHDLHGLRGCLGPFIENVNLTLMKGLIFEHTHKVSF